MEELQYLKEKSQFSKFVRCDIIMTKDCKRNHKKRKIRSCCQYEKENLCRLYGGG